MIFSNNLRLQYNDAYNDYINKTDKNNLEFYFVRPGGGRFQQDFFDECIKNLDDMIYSKYKKHIIQHPKSSNNLFIELSKNNQEKESLILNYDKAYKKFTPFFAHYECKWLGIEDIKKRLKEAISSKKFHLRIKALEILIEKYYKRSTAQISHYINFGIISLKEASVLGRPVWWHEFYNRLKEHDLNYLKGNYLNCDSVTKGRTDYVDLSNVWKEPILFDKWAKGETGYPIIDESMKMLNNTGFLPNRLRMITASFLVKDMLIDWRLGEKYFASKLIDYEPTMNWYNWQTIAGFGPFSLPWFRVFNPDTQFKKYYYEYFTELLNSNSNDDKLEKIVDHDAAKKEYLKTMSY